MIEKTIHYKDVPSTHPDVLLALPHHELEEYIREARSIQDNAQMVHDRLRAVRMEKVRREAIPQSPWREEDET